MALVTDQSEIVYRKQTGLDFISYSDYELDLSSPLAGGAAYVEGEIVAPAQARISLFDQGFIHSDVTYTVFHVWNGKAFRLDEHIDRLFSNAASLRIVPPLSKDEMRALALDIVSKSQLREAFVNLTITRGYSSSPGERDITKHRPQVYGYSIPYAWIVPFEGIEHGVPCMIARSVRRSPRNVIDPQVKNFQWGDLIRAIQETQDRGYEGAPVLLDSDGLIAEGPGFNVLIVKGNTLYTPGRNALPGITRLTVMQIAEELGLTVEEADITEAEFLGADEILGSTTAGGVWPFTSVNDTTIGDGTPGPHSRAIIRRYWEWAVSNNSLLTSVDY